MTEGQKLHRLLGVLYGGSKKSIFYEELAESFNEGLWFGKVTEKEVLKLCETLVRDDLAHYVGGSHAAAAVPSDRESSKGIAISNTAFTAYINKKYIEGDEVSLAPRFIAGTAVVVAVAAVISIFYIRSSAGKKLEQAEKDYQELLLQKERAFARLDSVVRMKDSIASKQNRRIMELQNSLAASKQAAASKKTPKKRR